MMETRVVVFPVFLAVPTIPMIGLGGEVLWEIMNLSFSRFAILSVPEPYFFPLDPVSLQHQPSQSILRKVL